MSNLTGTKANQIPLNSDLGSMAYMDVAHANKVLSSGRRNLLHNVNFEVNQRGVTYPLAVSSGVPAFVCDRWKTHASGMAVEATVAEVTLPTGEVCNSLKSVAKPTTDYTLSWLHPVQYLEFNNFYRGKTVVFSAWVRTSVPNQKFRFCDGTNCYTIGEPCLPDGQWHYMWAKATIATDATAMNWQVFNTGESFVDGDYLEIAQPQLEFGEYPTPYDYRPIAEELPICQRYFQSYGVGTGSAPMRIIGSGNGGSNMLTGFQFPVEMRTAPSLNYYGGGSDGGNFNVYVHNTATNNTAPSSTDVNAQSVRWNFSGNGSYPNSSYWIDVGSGSNQFGWTQDAEVA